MKKIALSGIQTSGTLHIGNYLGSINNWLQMQGEYKCYFFLADLHSITVDQDPANLFESTLHTAAIYLAAGIDPKKSAIFTQSSVPEHAELAWLLNCMTPLGWLKRMTQFKDKAGKKQDIASTGLFTYPVLMASDILLYNADVVPVGDDQKQHIELTRDIAGAVNRKFDKEVLKMPEPMIIGKATRVMSLRDGTKKMSKSEPSAASRIELTDSPDEILQKFKKAKTDSIAEITYDTEERPEVANLINILSAFTDKKPSDIVAEYESKGFAELKTDIAEAIIERIAPLQVEYQKLMNDKAHLVETLKHGGLEARERASKTYLEVKKCFGFL